ncbi:MAG: phosphotransferase [Candidatus ainarchaeum sp.]|nr:phosphotransferase [Candidatus ainarchaeum sp.]
MSLSNADLKNILANYKIISDFKVKKPKTGISHKNWIIKINKSKLVLREIRDDESEQDILFEFELLNKLTKNGFKYKIPNPIKNKSKKFITEYKNKKYWAYNFVEGDLFKLNKHNIKNIAKLIAEFHKITKTIKIKYIKKWPGPYSLSRFRLQIEEELNKPKNIKLTTYDKIFFKHSKIALELTDYLLFSPNKQIYDALPKIPIQGEIYSENILVNKNKISGIIDFEHCRNEIKIKDICRFFVRTLVKTKGQLDISFAKQFIKEYNKTFSLSKEELLILPDVLISEALNAFYWDYVLGKDKKDFKKRIENSIMFADWCFKNRKKLIKELSH